MTTSRNKSAALLFLCMTQLCAGWSLPSARAQRGGDEPEAISRKETPAHSFSAAPPLVFSANDDDSRPDIDGHPHVADALGVAVSIGDPGDSAPVQRREASSLILLAPKQSPPPVPRPSRWKEMKA